MTITQRLSLLWRRFSPLEEQLLARVREVLPPQAQPIFDAQVAAITLVRHYPDWTGILFYRRRHGKADWSDVSAFPRTGEFPLAEIRFTVEKRRYKPTLTAISGHIFDFAITPSARAIAFAAWDPSPSARLLSDPMTADSSRAPEPIPAVWREFLTRRPQNTTEWAFHNSETAYRITFDEGEFLVLAERDGDQFVLHHIEPAASTLFYLNSHDAIPEPIEGAVDDLFRHADKRNG